MIVVFFLQSNQLQNILLMLRLEKLSSARRLCTMKGHMALLLILSQKDVKVDNYISRILEQVRKLSADDNRLQLLRIMSDGCDLIFIRDNIFEHGEFHLIGMEALCI